MKKFIIIPIRRNNDTFLSSLRKVVTPAPEQGQGSRKDGNGERKGVVDFVNLFSGIGIIFFVDP